MQTDRNTARGGSGKAAGSAGVGREAAGLDDMQAGSEAMPQHDREAEAAREQRVVAYRERLQVEPAAEREQLGEAEVSIRIREEPERFEVTRGHDECVVRRSDIDGQSDGEVIEGRPHEFVERSVKVPLYGESAEIVVHKVAEPYAVADVGTKRVEDTQTFETVLRTEEIVENVAPSASGMSVREVLEGRELREGEMAEQHEETAEGIGDTTGNLGERKGRHRWF